MIKYVTIKVSGVIIAIGTEIASDLPGTYTQSIIEKLLLSEEEMNKMSEREINSWIKKSNKFMTDLCDLMNKHQIKQ